MIAYHAVVPDMRISHDQQMAADFGQPSTLHSAAVDRHVLADLIVIPDLQPRRFALVGHILRRHADCGEREESIVHTNPGGPFNRHVGYKMTALAKFDVRSDHAIRTHLAR